MVLSKPRLLAQVIAHVLRMGTLGATTLAVALPAHAACDRATPLSGETSTCDSTAPNPQLVGVQAAAGSTDVVVNVLAGASLAPATGAGVHVRDRSSVNNLGSIALSAGNTLDALFAEGNGNTLINNAVITTAGSTSDGLQANGSGNVLANGASGSITTGGANAHGLLSLGGSGNTLSNAGSIVANGTGASAIQVSGGASNAVVNRGELRALGGGHGISVSATGSVVTNETTGRIFSQSGRGVAMTAGGTLVNDGSIVSQTGTAVAFGGAAGGTLVNRGTITGGVESGAAADRLDMLGGTISGAIAMGAGDDVLVMRDGQLASVNQGDGSDRFEISGGTVTGTVQQGSGIDDFTMSGGQIAALLQGDNRDTFRMTSGRIVGAFEDGDSAVMTGGRIGRVDMKLDDNLFDMSGGTIDGNLVTGFGNDTILLSDGYIGGNISVSGGNDAVTVTGGTVRGEVRISTGNDAFTWDGGGVIYGAIDLGEGTDTALLRNLGNAHLGATPSMSGGNGVDALVFDNVTTGGVARFGNWESIALRNDSILSFDGDLVLGDAASGTGGLAVDATSTLFAGNGVHASIRPSNSTLLASVANNGRIDLTNGNSGATDTFTIVGNYVGTNAAVFLQAQLGDDSSPADRLVISGGAASGHTGLNVFNLDGQGGSTLQDGILVVQALGGGSSTPDAFALSGVVAAGAFEYFLFKGGISEGTAENWYLRSTLVAPPAGPPPAIAPGPDPDAPTPPAVPTPPPAVPPPPPPLPPPDVVPDNPDPEVPPAPPPAPPPEPPPAEPPTPPPPLPPVPEDPPAIPVPGQPGEPTPPPPPNPEARAATGQVIPLYRVETAAYAVVPPVVHQMALASLGTFHERQGEQSLQRGEGAVQAAWGRVIGQDTEQTWSGTVMPTFDGSLWGVQAGLEIYGHRSDDGRSDHLGVFLGRVRADGDVRGFAIGWNHLDVGTLELDDTHLGLSWTRIGPKGGYVDVVLMGSRYDGDARSVRGLGIALDGDGVTASVEAGMAHRWNENSRWMLESQWQLVWQHLSFDDQADAFADVGFDPDDAVTGRFGLRLSGDFATARGLWQPYLKANLWHGFGGQDRVRFDGDGIASQQEYNAVEFGGGVVARFNARLSMFAVLDYTVDLGDADEQRKSLEGNLGMRVDW